MTPECDNSNKQAAHLAPMDRKMTQTILANARIVLPEEIVTGAVVLEDGRIARIDTGTAVPAGATDCEGDLVMPGLIELHTDNLERHIEPRPGVSWPREAAILAHDAELAGAGITTVFDALRVGSILGGDSEYRKYAREVASTILDLRAADALRITHLIHLRAEVCSQTLIEEFSEFGPGDHIGIVSLMDHTPGQRQFRDLSKLEQYMRGKRGMSPEAFRDHVAYQLELSATYGARHEAAVLDFARTVGATLASHDDTDRAQVATSAAHGIRLAEFPTTTEAAEACTEAGIRVIMGAPNLIRGGSHSGNVAARTLADAGHLDIVSSDYVPAALLTGALHLGALWGDLPRGLRTVTATPAAAAGLTDRGRIAEGLRADVIRVRPLGPVTALLRGTWVGGERVA